MISGQLIHQIANHNEPDPIHAYCDKHMTVDVDFMDLSM
jgi:hypothetical protein